MKCPTLFILLVLFIIVKSEKNYKLLYKTSCQFQIQFPKEFLERLKKGKIETEKRTEEPKVSTTQTKPLLCDDEDRFIDPFEEKKKKGIYHPSMKYHRENRTMSWYDPNWKQVRYTFPNYRVSLLYSDFHGATNRSIQRDFDLDSRCYTYEYSEKREKVKVCKEDFILKEKSGVKWGDHIQQKRTRFFERFEFTHEGIYIGCGLVVEFRSIKPEDRKLEIMLTSFSSFYKQKPYPVEVAPYNYKKVFSPEQVTIRALGALKYFLTIKYSWHSQNCQHLAAWIKSGNKISQTVYLFY
eukprot:gene9818-2141_t